MLAREQVEQVVRGYSAGQKFQSREIRKKLGLEGSDRDSIARLHNYLKAMEKDGLIERVPGDQKRNQFFILNPVKFQEPPSLDQVGVLHKETSSKKPQEESALQMNRLGRIEDTLLMLGKRLVSVENKLDKVLTALQ